MKLGVIMITFLVGVISIVFGISMGMDMKHEEPPKVYYIHWVGNQFNTEEQIMKDLSLKALATCQDLGFTRYEEYTNEDNIKYWNDSRENVIESEFARSMYVTCEG